MPQGYHPFMGLARGLQAGLKIGISAQDKANAAKARKDLLEQKKAAAREAKRLADRTYGLEKRKFDEAKRKAGVAEDTAHEKGLREEARGEREDLKIRLRREARLDATREAKRLADRKFGLDESKFEQRRQEKEDELNLKFEANEIAQGKVDQDALEARLKRRDAASKLKETTRANTIKANKNLGPIHFEKVIFDAQQKLKTATGDKAAFLRKTIATAKRMIETELSKKGMKGGAVKTNYGTEINTILGGMGYKNPSDATPEDVKLARKIALKGRTEVSAATGAAGERRKEIKAYNEQRNRVASVVKKLDTAIAGVRKNPRIFGTVGNASAFITGIADQIKSFGNLLNPNFNVEGEVDHVISGLSSYAKGVENDKYNALVNPFTTELRKAGIQNRVFQGQVMSIAIAAASIEAIDGKGRLTADMVKRKIQEFNARGNSPEAFIKSALRVRADLVSRVRARKASLGGIAADIPPPPTANDDDVEEPISRFSDFEIIAIEDVR